MLYLRLLDAVAFSRQWYFSFEIHFSFSFYMFYKQSFLFLYYYSYVQYNYFSFYKFCKQSFLYLFYYSFVNYNHFRLYVFFCNGENLLILFNVYCLLGWQVHKQCHRMSQHNTVCAIWLASTQEHKSWISQSASCYLVSGIHAFLWLVHAIATPWCQQPTDSTYAWDAGTDSRSWTNVANSLYCFCYRQ